MRMIDADALINTLQEMFDKREKEARFTGDRGVTVTWNDAIYHIKAAPTIEERKKGNWIIDDDWNMCDIEGTLIGTKEFECDKCGYRELVFDGTVTHLNYCPNCGADMRGEGHE